MPFGKDGNAIDFSVPVPPGTLPENIVIHKKWDLQQAFIEVAPYPKMVLFDWLKQTEHTANIPNPMETWTLTGFEVAPAPAQDQC